jgi:hypothetical protein
VATRGLLPEIQKNYARSGAERFFGSPTGWNPISLLSFLLQSFDNFVDVHIFWVLFFRKGAGIEPAPVGV